MKKLIFVTIALISTASLSAQDTARVRFAPGTLAGKYYGTYDTSSTKPVRPVSTSVLPRAGENAAVISTTVSQGRDIKPTKTVDPIEVSGTSQVTGIDISGPKADAPTATTPLSGRRTIEPTKTFDPLEVSGTTQIEGVQMDAAAPRQMNAGAIAAPGTINVTQTATIPPLHPVQALPYRSTRLGSSSPLYDTYKTNDFGAGSVTTNQHKGDGSGGFAPVATQTAPPLFGTSTPLWRHRLGSSSPQYDTYEKNNYGAGSVTTNQHKGTDGGWTPSPEQAPPAPPSNTENIYRSTRLGSSSPVYNTYRSNDYGAGSVTTNPNKAAGYAPALPIAQPEQTPEVASKNGMKNEE